MLDDTSKIKKQWNCFNSDTHQEQLNIYIHTITLVLILYPQDIKRNGIPLYLNIFINLSTAYF